MHYISVCVLVFCGLFYFSEGKPCPEKTRAHKTRCDAYYKCKDMQSNRHVWVPELCDKGLVYEHNLHICVLPADDWECSLGDNDNAATPPDAHAEHKANDNDDYVVRHDDVDVPSNAKDDRETVELIVDSSSMSNYDDDSEEQDSFDSSGDGGELVELDGFMQAENRESDDHDLDDVDKKNTVQLQESGGETIAATSSNIDPKLTAHLQRLSQLIDGLKETYQNNDGEQSDMRPDQLNAFLAHFNIKNKFHTFNPTVPISGQDFVGTTTTTSAPVTMITGKPFKSASKNKTLLQDHLNRKLQPETKVVLTNGLPHAFDRNGYSNSQIVVNRPEGSVMFSLPAQYGSETMHEHSSEYAHNSPKISEETLKTVLELSKQMIASQNVPKVIQNPAFYPQPIYPVFVSSNNFPGASHKNPFSAYFQNNHNNNNPNIDDCEPDDPMGGPSPSYHKVSHYHGYKKPSKNRPNGSSGSSNYGDKPSTTIIHNNVIPLHLTSTNSGEKEVVDSYGQSLGMYPPHTMTSGSGDVQNINHMHHHHTHRYENNKFITSVTTVRPIISSTPANHYAAQYQSPYASGVSLTTPGTLNVAEYYTPSPHLNENNVNSVFQYENLPRPIDANRPELSGNGYQQVERPTPNPSSYYQQQQQQPMQHNHNALFPGQIDPNKIQIRPNSQKIESMEVENDEIVYQQQQQQQQQQQPQVLTYSYGNDRPSMNNQLAPTLSYSEPSTNILSGSSNPYMSRPSVYSSNGGSNSISTVTISPNKPKYPQQSGGYDGENVQLVNVGGNFISYDVFQNTILPLMGGGTGGLSPLDTLNSNVEVITCAPGVRQPNTTDCTRYYVCSKKDGKVLSYSCPPYTAFNGQTRICDAHTYSYCSPDAIASAFTVNENKRIQLEALKALQDAKRRRQQALAAQSNLSALLNQYNTADMGGSAISSDKDMMNAYIGQAPSMGMMVSTTMRPTVVSAMPVKKRKYYCKEGDKIADQTSITNYFVCYKNAQGQMKGHKMSCSKGLIFCPKSKMCTLSSKCL